MGQHLRAASASSQTGAALISALIIVAIVTVLAVIFSETFNLNATRAENRWHGSQAKQYLLATETLAEYFLQDDAKSSETDNLTETWATPIAMPTDEGLLEAQLEDAQGRLNLNSIALPWTPPGDDPNSLQPWQRFSPQQQRFIRLLQIFESYPLNEQEAIEVIEAVIDWVDNDGDDITGYGGAEALHYSNLKVPYYPANQPFDSVSELQMVKGITPQLYTLLEPLLIALPTGEEVLNLNTALPQVLRTINSQESLQPISEEDVQQIIEERDLQQFTEMGDFFSNPIIQDVVPNVQSTNAGYGVASDYFLLHARTTVGEQVRHVTSLLHREDEKISVIKRRYTSF